MSSSLPTTEPHASRRAWPWEAAVAAVLFFFAGTVFVTLADDAVAGRYLEGEREMMTALRTESGPLGGDPAVILAKALSWIGSFWVIGPVSVCVFAHLIYRRRRARAILLAIVIGGEGLLNLFLKFLFVRPRPEFVAHLVEVNSASFPSGHSMGAATFYLTVAFWAIRRTHSIVPKILIGFGGAASAALIGLSRVYLGVHFPTDVLGGWAAGTAWAALGWFCFETIVVRRQMDTPPPETR